MNFRGMIERFQELQNQHPDVDLMELEVCIDDAIVGSVAAKSVVIDGDSVLITPAEL